MSKEPAIEYPLVATGAEQVARAYGSIDAALAKNVASAGKFDEAVTRAAERLTTAYTKRAADALVKNRLQLDDNSRSANSLRASLDTLSVSTTKLSSATTSQARQTQTAVLATSSMAQNTQRLLPTFSALGAALSRLSPELGQIATSVGRASGAVSGFNAVIGGVGGLVGGGVIALTGLAITAYQHFSSETENLATATIKYNTTLDAQIQLLERASKLQSFKQQVAMGVAGPVAQEAEVRRLETQGMQIGYDQGEATSSKNYKAASRLDAARRKNEADLKLARANMRFAYEAEAAAQADEIAEEMSPKNLRASGNALLGTKQGKSKTALERGQAENAALQSDIATRIQAAKNAKAANPDAEALVDRSALGVAGQSKASTEAFRAEQEAKRSEILKTAEVQARAMDAQMAQTKALGQIGRNTYEMLGGTGIKALQALAKGQKVSGKQVIGAIGDQLVAQGTVWLFQGIAESISLNPQGPLHIGVGTAAIAAGIGMGAASAGGGNGGAAGGAGGRPAATPIAASRDTGARSREPVHVTVQYSALTRGSGEDGENVVRAIRQGLREGRYSREFAN